MVRLTRTRILEVPKEGNYVCGKCGARGNCADSIADAKSKKFPFFWHDGIEKIVCMKCSHKLETKEELYDFPLITEIQTYGFWLRFASEHYIPCDKCQEKLHEMLTTQRLAFSESNCITLEEYPKKGNWRFLLRFMPTGHVFEDSAVFIPCESCQKNILKETDKKELHIGVDEKPLVELWRKWEIIEN